MQPLILHIPHASTVIPSAVRAGMSATEAELAEEIRILTDHHTDMLFGGCAAADDVIVASPVSRLVVDVERFPDDAAEPMSRIGMGAVYLRGAVGQVLRSSLADRATLMQKYYEPHHQALEAAVQAQLAATGRAVIIDCHSFPEHALPYEQDQSLPRPEICIGTDPYHTPEVLAVAVEDAYRASGFSMARNTPFAGAIVPLVFNRRDTRVISVMIELRRDIYMDETSSKLNADTERVRQATAKAIAAVRWFADQLNPGAGETL